MNVFLSYEKILNQKLKEKKLQQSEIKLLIEKVKSEISLIEKNYKEQKKGEVRDIRFYGMKHSFLKSLLGKKRKAEGKLKVLLVEIDNLNREISSLNAEIKAIEKAIERLRKLKMRKQRFLEDRGSHEVFVRKFYSNTDY